MTPVLADTLSVILPTAERTLLLRAALQTGGVARAAWAAWLQAVGDPKQALSDGRHATAAWLPLLLDGLRRNGIAETREVSPYLRAAHVREELRGQTLRGICRGVLSALVAAEIPTVVLGGAALAESVYAQPALRHVHALYLLVRDVDFERAARTLSGAGLSRCAAPDTERVAARLQHASGLPVHLRSRLFGPRYHVAPVEELWARSRPHDVAGVAVRILAPADALLYACGAASGSPHRASLQWVSDAWQIVARSAYLDWETFVATAESSRVALPLWVMLHYLAEQLQAPVAPGVLEHLAAVADQAEPLTREIALLGARVGPGGTPRALLRATRAWRTRLFVLRFIVLPSPAFLLSTGRVRHAWVVPAYYLYRPLRIVARQLGSRFTGLPLTQHGA